MANCVKIPEQGFVLELDKQRSLLVYKFQVSDFDGNQLYVTRNIGSPAGKLVIEPASCTTLRDLEAFLRRYAFPLVGPFEIKLKGLTEEGDDFKTVFNHLMKINGP